MLVYLGNSPRWLRTIKHRNKQICIDLSLIDYMQRITDQRNRLSSWKILTASREQVTSKRSMIRSSVLRYVCYWPSAKAEQFRSHRMRYGGRQCMCRVCEAILVFRMRAHLTDLLSMKTMDDVLAT
jgi:hypothetical protein